MAAGQEHAGVEAGRIAFRDDAASMHHDQRPGVAGVPGVRLGEDGVDGLLDLSAHTVQRANLNALALRPQGLGACSVRFGEQAVALRAQFRFRPAVDQGAAETLAEDRSLAASP
ncbi:MAG: hypothetical protein ACR2J1_11485 [Methyloceanibacter sp.]|uniref:hypothetical protein n=1 Tax=Methyloceanibacter sp. TaxID=1965321 RepID=UPI003D9ABB9C